MADPKVSFAEQVEALERANTSECSVKKLIAKCGFGDELVAVLASGASHAAVSRALRARGFEIQGGTIARHRKGECHCEPR